MNTDLSTLFLLINLKQTNSFLGPHIIDANSFLTQKLQYYIMYYFFYYQFMFKQLPNQYIQQIQQIMLHPELQHSKKCRHQSRLLVLPPMYIQQLLLLLRCHHTQQLMLVTQMLQLQYHIQARVRTTGKQFQYCYIHTYQNHCQMEHCILHFHTHKLKLTQEVTNVNFVCCLFVYIQTKISTVEFFVTSIY